MTILKQLANTDNRSSLVKSVKECTFDSGGLDGQSNSVFEAEIQAFDRHGIHWTPTLTINNEWYKGNLICPNPIDIATCSVYAAICAVYAPETIPQVCLERREGCSAGDNLDSCGVCSGNGSSCITLKPMILALMFLLITIIIAGIGCLILIYLKSRLALAEGQLVILRNRYEPLQDSDQDQ